MSTNPEGSSAVVTTRLKFAASPLLSNGIRQFSYPQRVATPGKELQPLTLYSRQFVELDLKNNRTDIETDQDYADILKDLTTYQFQLEPAVKRIDFPDGDIELEFGLNLSDREKDVLIGHPLFRDAFNEDEDEGFKIYRRLHRRRLLSGQAINIAQTRLKTKMRDTLLSHGQTLVAPYDMYVDNIRLNHRRNGPSDIFQQ